MYRKLIGGNKKAGLIGSDYEEDLIVENELQPSVTDLFRLTNPEAIEEINESKKFMQILSLGLKSKSKFKVLEAIEELKKSIKVLSAEPDYNYDTVENAVSIEVVSIEEKTLEKTDFTDEQWSLSAIQMQKAWGITHGSKDVVVGIYEPGLHMDHEDLKDVL